MRATRAVQALLRLLPSQPEGGWTQARVEAALQQQGICVNRVTVYRALDRLAQAGLLQRTVDAQRVTRYRVPYQAVDADQPAASAHMECTRCHQHQELGQAGDAVQAALQALRQALVQSTGVHNPWLDVTVQGECSDCTADHEATAPAFSSNPQEDL